MSESSVLFAVDDGIATITLNRPDRLNAFAGRMRQELGDVFERAGRDDRIRVLVVTGAGRAFCAGADVAYMRELVIARAWDEARELVAVGARVVSTVASLQKPVIAAVNGPAAGGGANLALACDLRIASERAAIGQTFNRVGLHPDWGGTYFLPRLVGPAKALELILTADMIDAAEALRIGLFNRVVPHDRLLDETQQLAARLAAKPALPLALAKRACGLSMESTLDTMLALEIENQVRCFQTADALEGIRAFAEKREPVFRGE